MIADKVANEFLDSIVERVAQKLLPEILERIATQLPLVEDRQVDIKEAVTITGFSEETLYKMCAEKQLPHIRGGVISSRRPAIKFSTASLNTWKREQERKNYQPVQEKR